MVLPGWNVTEPINAAFRFYQLVQSYRDASEEIRDFASQVDAFRQVLEAFDCCRTHPESVDVEVRRCLHSVAESCRQCAENCTAFVDRFFKRYENTSSAEIGAANKLLWVWKKEKGMNLGAKMRDQVNLINVHINLAEWRSRQLQQQSSSSNQTSHIPIPITPAALLGRRPSPSVLIGSVPRLDSSPPRWEIHRHPEPQSHNVLSADGHSDDALTLTSSPVPDSPMVARLDTRRFSLPDYVLQRPRQGSYRWCKEKTMANLVGVFLHRNYGSKPALPISRIEFLQDSNDNLSHIVSSYANVKFFQKLSRSPPSIPHTEHPTAYNGNKLLMVKFLEPHKFTLHEGPASVGGPLQRNQPHPSPITLGPSAIPATSDIFASSGIVRDPLTVGSPSMPIHGSRVRVDTAYPMYEFKLVEDYDKFQELIVGKKLLMSAPIEKIEFKPVNSSKLRKESEKQYLRLWAHKGVQTIMFNANYQNRSPVYVEHDMELFYESQVNASPRQVVLCIKRNGPKQVSEALQTVDHVVIHFSDQEDKKLFLGKANFHGSPNPTMIPPLGLMT